MNAKSQRRKSKATNYPVPQSRDEASDMIAEIGRNSRALQRIEANMNDEIAAIKEQFEKAAEPLRERNEALHNGVQLFCEARRERLTNDGRVKFHKFAAGEVSWRNRPPSATVRGADKVIEYCESHELTRFVIVTKKANREAMRSEPEVAKQIPGVSIGSAGEDFIIEPHEAELSQNE